MRGKLPDEGAEILQEGGGGKMAAGKGILGGDYTA